MQKTILHVEDRPETTFFLRNFLESKGYKVINAMNTDDADIVIEECNNRSEQINFLILDMHLPLYNDDFLEGWQWFEKTVKSDPSYLNKTIIFSAYIDLLLETKPNIKTDYPDIILIDKKFGSGSSYDNNEPFSEIYNALKKLKKLS